MIRTAMMMMALTVTAALIAPAAASTDGPAPTAFVEVRIDGASPALRDHVRQAMSARLTADPRTALTTGVPEPVRAGAARGYILDLQVDRQIERTADGVQVSCSILESIWDLNSQSLRGSANQKAEMKLHPSTPDAEIDMHLATCLDALMPATHAGMTDFLVESPR